MPDNLAKPNHSSASPEFIDPAALMRIKNLQLRAKVVVEGFYNGLHRSPYHGFSVEFSEYRPYTPGDDTRYVDWKLWARTDRYYIKKFEDETNRRVYLIVDLSRSMSYGSIEYQKVEYARTLAATLAYYLTLQRDTVGISTFDEAIVDYLPARYRPGHFRRILSCLDKPVQGKGTDLSAPLEQVAKLVKKRGLVVLISDLLASIETLDTSLGHLRARGHEVLVLRTLDPAEIDFPFSDASMFRDVEAESEMYVDPDRVREDYKQRFEEHQLRISEVCSSIGADYVTLKTDQPMETALFDLLVAQTKKGRQIARRLSAGGSL